MKITKQLLREIIEEEIKGLLNEASSGASELKMFVPNWTQYWSDVPFENSPIRAKIHKEIMHHVNIMAKSAPNMQENYSATTMFAAQAAAILGILKKYANQKK